MGTSANELIQQNSFEDNLPLIENAIESLTLAKGHMLRNNTIEKCKCIGHILDLVMTVRDKMQAYIHKEQFALLDGLFCFIEHKLVAANINNLTKSLDKIRTILNDVIELWFNLSLVQQKKYIETVKVWE